MSPAIAAALLLALQTPAAPRGAAGADTLDAFLDEGARELVRAARERRDRVDRSVTAYRTLARERVSVGVRALSRDRILFRREMAARIHWRREGPVEVEALGARQVVPIALPRPKVPEDVRDDITDLVFDPAAESLLDWSRHDHDEDEEEDRDGDDIMRHPLAPGGEASYRFRSGDVAQIRLPEGRTIRLRELQVIPRPGGPPRLRGSLWLDAETHAVVRASFQLTRPVDMQKDLGEDDEDIPGVLQPIRGELRYITVEYALWRGRWWLPRLISLDVLASAGTRLGIPVTFERAYEGYEVEGDTAAAPVARAAYLAEERERSRCDEGGRSCEEYRARRYDVKIPADSTALLHSEHLPPSIYSEGERFITESELRTLAGELGVRQPGVAGWEPSNVSLRYLDADLLRYNRVEGLALGARADTDFGPLHLDAALWLPTAALEPVGEVGVGRTTLGGEQRLALYRRLRLANPETRALGTGNSLAALLLGRDEGEYYRAFGVEVAGASAGARRWDYAWRLFAERQGAADKSTDFSLPHLFDGSRDFAHTLDAATADQVGAELTLGVRRGLDPVGFRWGAELSALASAGDFGFVRPSLSTFLGVPLPGPLVGALTLSGGTAFGDAPPQQHWYLGGPSTVRGYGAGSRVSGEAFWRGRAEVASDFTGARLVLFSDAGWAGARDDVRLDPALLSAGVGASFLDGLLRADLARALRGRTGWRLDLYLDGVL